MISFLGIQLSEYVEGWDGPKSARIQNKPGSPWSRGFLGIGKVIYSFGKRPGEIF